MRLFDFFFFFSSRRRHTRLTCDWSSDVCSSDLRDVAVAKPGEDERVEAALKRDGFNPTRGELRVEALPFEHVARQGDGPRGRVDTVDVITELEQRDQIASCTASDHEDAIRGL